MKEIDEQIIIFEWARLHSKKWPCLAYMYSSLSGINLTMGQAMRAKRAGNTKGRPDIHLPLVTKKYSGLFIELKVGNNKPSKEQKEYLEYLRSQGYYADVRYGSVEAIDLIKDYLEELI